MNANRFRFGLFEFDPALRELRREGVPVHLQSQPAQVLACLIEHSGKVVTREQLRAAIWGNETHVDFDRGLNFCIAQVRSALNDDSVTPRYIRTVTRRGYQFIAPIERLGELESPIQSAAVPAKGKSALAITGSVCMCVLLLSLAAAAGYWLRSSKTSKHRPIIAVLRFDNETRDPAMTRFSDALTDNVVERLTSTSLGRYDVIGNAHILRLPRDQRDIASIASALHAQYVILGQVQTSGTQTRILAHLIRLPEQTHLWVSRMDRSLSDPLGVESEAAQKIASEFSPRVVTDSSGTPLPPLPNR
jgi:DNA-binding winged helix-turn-helix (wHTH) protein/TolB-like protein